MRVLLINTLYLRTHGNQALYNCLIGLAEAGHDVIVLQIRGEDIQAEMREMHPRISIKHHAVLPKPIRRMVLKLYGFLKRTEQGILRGSASVTQGGRDNAGYSSSYWGYQSGAPESHVQNLIDKFHWMTFQVLALWHGLRVIRSESIDVVYGYEAWGAPAASLLGWMFRLPVVTRFQGTYILGQVMNSRWKRLMYFDRVVATKSQADLVVMTNDGTKGDKVLELLGVPKSRVLFITNGVNKPPSVNDDQGEIRSELGMPSGAHVILTVCNLTLTKRVDRAIRALPAVLQTHSNALLVVVGGGPELDRLKRLAENLQVEHAVKFMGQVPHTQVSRYFAAADIFLSMYEFSNRGNPLFEALAHGCCIVTLADGSVDDLVATGDNGVLVDPERVEEHLPRVITTLLDDPVLHSRLKAGANKTATEVLKTWEERNRIEVQRIEAIVMDSFLDA